MKSYILLFTCGFITLATILLGTNACVTRVTHVTNAPRQVQNTGYTCPQSVYYQDDTQYDKYMDIRCEGCGGATDLVYVFEHAESGNLNLPSTIETQCDYVYYMNGDPNDARHVQLGTLKPGTLVADIQYGEWKEIDPTTADYQCISKTSRECPIAFMHNN